jgi:hypothetical protein
VEVEKSILIEHISSDQLSSVDKTKSTGCWYPQVMHGFTAKEFPDAATEHCKAIGKATVRSLPGTFKLQFPPLRV